MSLALPAFLGALALLTATAASQDRPVLVKDINTGGATIDPGSNPASFTPAPGKFFFAAESAAHGVELWRSDGTADGTWMHWDVVPGRQSSLPRELTPLGDALLFVGAAPPQQEKSWTRASNAHPLAGVSPNGAFYDAVRREVSVVYRGGEVWGWDGTSWTQRWPTSVTPALDLVGIAHDAGRGVTVMFGGNDLSGQSDRTWEWNGTSWREVIPATTRPPSRRYPMMADAGAAGVLMFGGIDNGNNLGDTWLWDGVDWRLAATTGPTPRAFGAMAYDSRLDQVMLFGGNSADFDEVWIWSGAYESWFERGRQDDGPLPMVGHGLVFDEQEQRFVLFGAGQVWAYQRFYGWRRLAPDGAAPDPRRDFGIAYDRTRDRIVVQGGYRYLAGQGTAETWELGPVEGRLYVTRDLGQRGELLAGADPAELTRVRDWVVFSSSDPTNGRELWITDGVGTLVHDLAPGPASSDPEELTALGDTVFFSATNGAGRRTLFRTDGTAPVEIAGLSQLQDPRVQNLAVMGGALYFAADPGTTGGAGLELWCYQLDDTLSQVRDVNPGPAGSAPSQLTAVGNRLFFVATTAAEGAELWKSDGTTAGTTLVRDLVPGSGSPVLSDLTALDAVLMFTSNDPTFSVWRSDGTAGGTSGVAARASTGSVGALHRWRSSVVWSGSSGPSLWKYDEPFRDTREIHRFPPGTPTGYPTASIEFQGALYFDAPDSSNGIELWQLLDVDTVRLFKNLNPVASNGSSAPRLLTDTGPETFFFADDGTGERLWRSDGTEAGTRPFHQLLGPPRNPNNRPVFADGILFFECEQPDRGHELGVVAPSLFYSETYEVRPGPESGGAEELTDVNGQVYFRADDGVHGAELWIARRTTQGQGLVEIEQVDDLRPGPLGSNPTQITAFRAWVYFVANDGTTDGLFRADHRQETRLVQAGAVTSVLVDERDVLYFWLDGQVYTHDGLTTTQVTFFARTGCNDRGTLQVPATGISGTGGVLFTTCADANVGEELYYTDGTWAGTTLVADIEPGPGGSSPRVFHRDATFGVYFTAKTTATGREMYLTYGQGVTLLKDIAPGPADSVSATAADGQIVATGSDGVYFVADDGVHGPELWRHTRRGGWIVERVEDTVPGAGGLDAKELVLSWGKLMFRGQTPENGSELWTLDPGASVQPIGHGCAPLLQPQPRLWADDYNYGELGIYLYGTAPPLSGSLEVARLLFFASDTDHPSNQRLQLLTYGDAADSFGCALYLDMNWEPFYATYFALPRGPAWQHFLGGPSAIIPHQFQVTLQVADFHLDANWRLGLRLSNAVRIGYPGLK